MHNLTKIKIFRLLLWLTYPVALIFIYPFALLRKKNPSSLFFFFDRYAIGGAQKIHLDVLESVKDIHKQVYFTRKSPNDKLKHAFYSVPETDNRDIHTWCDYLLFRLFSVHYFAFYINRHSRAHVFSSNSTFFYDMLPFFGKRVYKTELLHNFSYGKKGMEFFGLANHNLLDSRIVYDSFTLSNIRDQYAQYKVDPIYNERILFIQPGVDIPGAVAARTFPPLKILYAGRGGPQKRVWLINRIAEHFIQRQERVEFHFAGPLKDEISVNVAANCIIHGEIGTKEAMDRLYDSCHVIMLTSAYEGFPMVIKEGMAHGCVPVVTGLEGNKMHLTDDVNSLLMSEVTNEDKVVEQGIMLLTSLLHDEARWKHLSETARGYAVEHFNKSRFMEEYRTFLLNNPA